MDAKKVPVSERALIQRVNRKLAGEGQKMYRARNPDYSNVGRFYIIDTDRNILLWKCLDLEKTARKEGALAAWEYLANGERK